MGRAKVAVLLISPEFYASKFIAEDELPPLLEAEQEQGLVILGVHVGYTLFDLDQKLRDFQTVNSPKRPLVSLTEAEQQQVLVKLARRIHAAGSATRRPEDDANDKKIPKGILGRLYGEIPKLPPQLPGAGVRISTRSRPSSCGRTGQASALSARGGAPRSRAWAGSARPCSPPRWSTTRRSALAFPDGIVWLTLGQTPDVLTLQRRLLAWVAPDKEPPTELQAGRDALDTALKSRRWLIVLDDVWRHD